MLEGGGWREIGRGGKVRGPRDAAGVREGGAGGRGGGAGGQGGGQGDVQGGGFCQPPYQQRFRPKVQEIRAKVQPRPNTIMLNCRQFQELPDETEVAQWFGDHLFTGEASPLLGRVGGLDIEERDKKIMVQLGSEQDMEILLTRIGEEGVSWPGFLDPTTGEPIKIRGFSADRSSLKVTLLDVPRDVTEETVRGVMEQFGRIEEVKRHHLTKEGMQHIKVNRVSVKMVKEKDKELPTMVIGLGSETSGEERSMWRLSYPGAPRRCYRCGHADHMVRECRRPPLTMRQVEKMPAVGEVQEEGPGQGETTVPRTFAAVVKSAKFIEQEAQQVREAARLQQEKLAKQVQEDRRKAEEKTDREAAKEAENARKQKEADDTRAANIKRLSAASKEAEVYKEKIKSLHKKTQSDLKESRDLEESLDKISSSGSGLSEGKRPRLASAALEAVPQNSL